MSTENEYVINDVDAAWTVIGQVRCSLQRIIAVNAPASNCPMQLRDVVRKCILNGVKKRLGALQQYVTSREYLDLRLSGYSTHKENLLEKAVWQLTTEVHTAEGQVTGLVVAWPLLPGERLQLTKNWTLGRTRGGRFYEKTRETVDETVYQEWIDAGHAAELVAVWSSGRLPDWLIARARDSAH